MTYCWQRDGAWQIGTAALVDGADVTRYRLVGRLVPFTTPFRIEQLIRLWPTGELTWVPVDELKPYPAEPIEEPS